MNRYEEVLFYYDTNMWAEDDVRRAFHMGYITSEQLDYILNL